MSQHAAVNVVGIEGACHALDQRPREERGRGRVEKKEEEEEDEGAGGRDVMKTTMKTMMMMTMPK